MKKSCTLLSAFMLQFFVGSVLAAEIEWRLENPFRFFERSADYKLLLDAQKLAGKSPGKLDPVYALETVLTDESHLQNIFKNNGARAIQKGWAAAGNMWSRTCWDSKQHKHKNDCQNNFGDATLPSAGSYTHPRAHMIIARVPTLDANSSEICEWSTEGGRKLIKEPFKNNYTALLKTECSNDVNIAIP